MGKDRQRNHEIPRFLLNRFASKAEGDTRWVWRIGRDASVRELSTRDVAASRRFYGSGRLEHALQDAEGPFSRVLADIARGQPPEAFSEELRQLVWTQAARTRAAREQFATAANDLLSEFAAFSETGDARDAAVRQVHLLFDEQLEKAVATLPANHRRWALDLLRVPAIRERFLDYVREYVGSNFGALTGAIVRIVQDRGIIPRSAEVGQIRGLAKLLDRRDSFGRRLLQTWRLAGHFGGSAQLRTRRWLRVRNGGGRKLRLSLQSRPRLERSVPADLRPPSPCRHQRTGSSEPERCHIDQSGLSGVRSRVPLRF